MKSKLESKLNAKIALVAVVASLFPVAALAGTTHSKTAKRVASVVTACTKCATPCKLPCACCPPAKVSTPQPKKG